MSRGLGRRGVHMLLVATALLAGAAGIALATIPGTGGTISGCYEKKTGILRVIDAQAGKTCLSFETPIAWNQQGLRGDPGAQGVQGKEGAKGDPGRQGLQGERGPQGLSGKLELAGGAAAAGTAGKTCPAGQFVQGFDPAGSLRCAAGSGDLPGVIQVYPAGLNFDSVPVGQSSTEVLTLLNMGGAPVESIQWVSTTVSPAFTSIDSTCGAGIAPGEACTITVAFTPTSPGGFVASWWVGWQPSGGTELTLAGTGLSQ